MLKMIKHKRNYFLVIGYSLIVIGLDVVGRFFETHRHIEHIDFVFLES